MDINVLREIEIERDFQDEKWGIQDHSDPLWATILGEEYGETCQATLTRRLLDNYAAAKTLRDELIQVAAVAVAWIEAIDGGLDDGNEGLSNIS